MGEFIYKTDKVHIKIDENGCTWFNYEDNEKNISLIHGTEFDFLSSCQENHLENITEINDMLKYANALSYLTDQGILLGNYHYSIKMDKNGKLLYLTRWHEECECKEMLPIGNYTDTYNISLEENDDNGTCYKEIDEFDENIKFLFELIFKYPLLLKRCN